MPDEHLPDFFTGPPDAWTPGDSMPQKALERMAQDIERIHHKDDPTDEPFLGDILDLFGTICDATDLRNATCLLLSEIAREESPLDTEP